MPPPLVALGLLPLTTTLLACACVSPKPTSVAPLSVSLQVTLLNELAPQLAPRLALVKVMLPMD